MKKFMLATIIATFFISGCSAHKCGAHWEIAPEWMQPGHPQKQAEEHNRHYEITYAQEEIKDAINKHIHCTISSDECHEKN